LRAWAEAQPDKKVEVFRLDLPDFPSSRHAPKYTAYEDNLYELTMPVVAGMDQQAAEKHLLQRTDALAAGVLRKLTTTGLAGLTLDDRCDWTRFLMSLRLRQPGIVQQLRTKSSEHLEAALIGSPEEYDTVVDSGDPPTLLEWTRQNYPGLIENFGMSIFHELVDNVEVDNKMLRMKWWLWDFTQEKNDLLVADQPCIFPKGIDELDSVIALPIGPSKAFMATRTDRVANIMRQQRPKNLLTRINESSLDQARTRVYACDACPRRFICNRLAKRRAAEREVCRHE
jgi:hypothetical protein